MSDPMKQAWDGVADGFSTLGRMMKERYQDRATTARPPRSVGRRMRTPPSGKRSSDWSPPVVNSVLVPPT